MWIDFVYQKPQNNEQCHCMVASAFVKLVWETSISLFGLTLLYLLTHSLTYLLTYLLNLTLFTLPTPLTHLVTYSPTNSLTYLLTLLMYFTYFTRSLPHSLNYLHTLTHLLNYLCIYLLTYILTYLLLTYTMEQSAYWEAHRFSPSQEILVLWNPKVHYFINKCLLPVPMLCQIDLVHTPTSHFLKIHFIIIFLSTPGSPKWSLSLKFPHHNPV